MNASELQAALVELEVADLREVLGSFQGESSQSENASAFIERLSADERNMLASSLTSSHVTKTIYMPGPENPDVESGEQQGPVSTLPFTVQFGFFVHLDIEVICTMAAAVYTYSAFASSDKKGKDKVKSDKIEFRIQRLNTNDSYSREQLNTFEFIFKDKVVGTAPFMACGDTILTAKITRTHLSMTLTRSATKYSSGDY